MTVISFLNRYKFSLTVAVIIFYASVLKPTQLPSVPLFFGMDKLVHLLMYGCLGLLLNYETKRTQKYLLSIVITLPILFGGVIEILQKYFFPPRSGEWIDFLANTTGVVFAYFIFHKILKNRLNRQ